MLLYILQGIIIKIIKIAITPVMLIWIMWSDYFWWTMIYKPKLVYINEKVFKKTKKDKEMRSWLFKMIIYIYIATVEEVAKLVKMVVKGIGSVRMKLHNV